MSRSDRVRGRSGAGALLAAALGALALGGCGGEGERAAQGQAGASGQAGAGGACGDRELARVEGRALDEAGEPRGDAAAQLCLGRAEGDLCLAPARADGGGAFAIEVPEELRCVRRAVVRLGTSGRTAPLYCPLGLGAEAVTMPAMRLIEVEATAGLIVGDPAAERAVVLGDGLEIKATPERFFAETGAFTDLGARRWEGPPPCFAGGALEGLYAFYPEGDVAGEFAFRVPNATGLAPGAAVIFSVLGGVACVIDDKVLPEGQWRVFARGHVEPSGEYLAPDPGQPGLPCLSWLGYAAE